MKLPYIYLLIAVLFMVFSYAFVDPNIFYLNSIYTGIYESNRLLVSFIYCIFILIFFGFYVHLMRKRPNLNSIKKYILFSLPLLFSYPAIFSFDIFNYILTAKLSFVYVENPYTVMPIEIPNEPMLAFTHAANKFALYGPLWILFTSLPLTLSFGFFPFTIIMFKFFTAIFYFLTLVIIYKLTRSTQSLLFFALNPLVIIETFVSGHNDVVMMALALTSFYFLTKRRIIIALFLIIFSILIKYATIFLLPLFIIVMLKAVRGERINLEKIGKWGFYSMLLIFLLSYLREEIYPWYAIWFLPFAALTLKNRFIFYLSIALSFFLMFRYVPFMWTGTHLGMTPIIKNILLVLPLVVVLIAAFFTKRKK